MQSNREDKAHNKRARLEHEIWVRKEKIQDRVSQREHDMKMLQESNDHEIRALQMKVELARIERENKQLELQRIALNKGVAGGEA
jgi:hypothetical protein